MSTITSLRAQVTDANHRPRGMMNIEFDGDAHGPYRVIHEGRTYWHTGKSAPTARQDCPGTKWRPLTMRGCG